VTTPAALSHNLPSDEESWLRPGRTLLVASTGGHLDQLVRFRKTFYPVLGDVEWVTFDTDQSRHLLADEVVHFVKFIEPKDFSGTNQAAWSAVRLMRGRRFVRVVSTGAAVAVPFITTARSMGMSAHYIESAARSAGPSLSGAMVARIPGVRLYAQYGAWTAGRWQFRGAIFDGFEPGPLRETGATPLRRVVVTFGTQRGFGFRRALERLIQVLPDVCAPDAEILWQVGATIMHGLPIQGVPSVPVPELTAAIREADLVVGHAGIGSALTALENGRCPVLLPRRYDRGEHTDDHQRQIARELARRQLAVHADASTVTAEDLLRAARMTAIPAPKIPPFILQPD
jgi:UDP-N-acetylglucosamine--N-acetylmuramyl-(pentapeptide) pyrophosphoryl-undecaprenol N-acetylglucosamine transferase